MMCQTRSFLPLFYTLPSSSRKYPSFYPRKYPKNPSTYPNALPLKQASSILHQCISSLGRSLSFFSQAGRRILYSQQYLCNSNQLPIMAKSSKNSSIEGFSEDSEEYRARPSKSKENKNKNRVRWSCEQNINYCRFLYINKNIFESQLLRKQQRIFLLLARALQSRTTSQVKSHHQKMMKRHLQVDHIITFMERKYKASILPPQDHTLPTTTHCLESHTDRDSFSAPLLEQQEIQSIEIFIPESVSLADKFEGGFDVAEWGW